MAHPLRPRRCRAGGSRRRPGAGDRGRGLARSDNGGVAVVDDGIQVLEASKAARTGAGWRRALAAVLVLGGAVLGAEVGGLVAVRGAEADASHFLDAHRFADALAVYADLATRSGPVYVLAQSDLAAAPVDAQRVYLRWAEDLAAAGRTDEALAACDRVTLPALRPTALRERARIALDAATAAAGRGDWKVALGRLEALLAGHPPADLAARARALRPVYALAAARSLVASDPQAAVGDLDLVVSEAPASPEAATATTLLPSALLAAGRRALAAHDLSTALSDLQRLVSSFPTSPAARTARLLLQAPQPVTGTVVRRDGSPVVGLLVRLGSQYRRIGTSYTTGPPTFFATTDRNGGFRFASVPVGGPYVLELLVGGSWTTIVAADGSPAYQVTITPLAPVDLAFVVLPG